MQEKELHKIGSITVEFELTDVTNKFLFHLDSLIKNVSLIHNSLEHFSNIDYLPLPTENLPIQIQHNQKHLSIKDQKKEAINWIINKSIEDLISGLFISLRESHKYLRYYNISFNSNIKLTKKQLDQELVKIEKELNNHHFPQFIKYLKSVIAEPIPYIDEIISYNKLRNCIVHRNGIVGIKDLHPSVSSSMTIKWVELRSKILIDNNEEQLKYKHREKPTKIQNIEHYTYHNKISFSKDQPILIDINIFNSMAFTCSLFVKELLKLIPRPRTTSNSDTDQ